jgi:hypothetical protein
MEEMREARAVRRAKLAKAIKRKRFSLSALKMTEDKSAVVPEGTPFGLYSKNRGGASTIGRRTSRAKRPTDS